MNFISPQFSYEKLIQWGEQARLLKEMPESAQKKYAIKLIQDKEVDLFSMLFVKMDFFKKEEVFQDAINYKATSLYPLWIPGITEESCQFLIKVFKEKESSFSPEEMNDFKEGFRVFSKKQREKVFALAVDLEKTEIIQCMLPSIRHIELIYKTLKKIENKSFLDVSVFQNLAIDLKCQVFWHAFYKEDIPLIHSALTLILNSPHSEYLKNINDFALKIQFINKPTSLNLFIKGLPEDPRILQIFSERGNLTMLSYLEKRKLESELSFSVNKENAIKIRL